MAEVITDNLKNDDENYEKVLNNTFEKVNNMLLNSDIDTELSGSTCVTLLVTDTHFYCANVGDSRAILARKNETNSK